MKKSFSILTAALLMLLVTPAFAQVSLGVGYVNSTDRIKSGNTEAQATASNGIYAGLGFHMPIAGDLSFTPGVYYTYLSNRNASSTAGGLISASGELKEHYLTVPLHFDYGAEILPNFRLFFFAGPGVSVGLASNTVLSASIAGISGNTSFDNYKDGTGYGRWDIQLGGGMGIDLAHRLRLKVGYDFGMLNRYTDSQNISRHRNQLHAGIAFLF